MLSYIDVRSTDPAYNLALEQYIFEALPREGVYFLLWQNDRSVIIGRHQDALAEINEDYVRRHGIRVVRRLSGGGAVYHDLGNLNYTFIADASDTGKLDFSLFVRPVIAMLASLGVTASLNGRNDITIEGQKISGNAQYIQKGRLLHHGTILFDSDLEAVEQALCVDEDKIRTKGIRSVRSRVTNVRDHLGKDVSLDKFRQLLLEHVLSEMPGEPLQLTQQDLAAVEAIRAERYATRAWNFGETTAETKSGRRGEEEILVKRRRVEGCGLVEVLISLEGGAIRNVTFQGDFFSLADLADLANRLIGFQPGMEAFAKALEGVDASQYIAGLSTEKLLEILGD